MAKAPIKVAGKELTPDDVSKIFKAVKSKGSPIIGKAEIDELCHIQRQYTDIPTLDFIGGFTKHRVNLLAGNPSACKSTIIQQVIPQIQKELKESNSLKRILYYDVEGAYDREHSANLGVDNEGMVIQKSLKVMEEIFEDAVKFIRTGMVECVVFDSFDAMIPRKQDDNEFNNTMGSQSGAIAAHFPSVFAAIEEFKVTTFIVKQARVKMGTNSPGEVITFNGGKALRHICDNIFIMKRSTKQGLTYIPITIKAEKTRSPRMGVTLELPLSMTHAGIDKVRDLMNICTELGILSVAGGGWTSFTSKDGTFYREQGSDKFLSVLYNNPKVYKELKDLFYSDYVNNNKVTIKSIDEEMIVDLDGTYEEKEGTTESTETS